MTANAMDELSIDELLESCDTDSSQEPEDVPEGDLENTGTFPVTETLLAPELLFSKEELD